MVGACHAGGAEWQLLMTAGRLRRPAFSAPARDAWVVTRRNYPKSQSEASAQITGISGGFIGTLRLSERTGKNRMVCTITMAGVEELESRELL